MRTIAHLPLKGDNYPIAWKKLRDTYDKPCYQLNLLLDKLAELQPIKVLNADSLDSRVKAIHLTFFAMRKLTQSDTDLIEALMCHRLLQTLDMETRKLWEEQLAYRESQTGSVRTETGGQSTAASPYPKMVDLVSWLNCRRDGLRSIKGCGTIERSCVKTSLKGKAARAFYAATKSLPSKIKRRCGLCSQEHFIGACPELKKKKSQGSTR
ncbi:hypothetical protein PUN28_000542 [Cardiocondyla obscurior]|uniref:Gag protein n=1 Tax=Cardiocondyla obscurior TaxID=286306 RepID=A0AAW2H0H5_9HYME